ncbi:dienelactone hydrolase family protein [Lysinibacillus cavernae]|uniref:dienelactone hydrolase family protein n=1 Tax=Lysinibacillus cavernae TaxID=2666135 RepID=UPI0012D982FE|nr:dienelactone hydrolase family protein [Lysinibacillus cavernae]
MKRKIFILHEIYGVNHFIKEQVQAYCDEDTSVSFISLYPEGLSFSYEKEKQAYDYFLQTVGFDTPLELLSQNLLKASENYDEVVLIGYSVGATLAWRLATLPLHRIICVYGSRIRQYLDVIPSCPTLVVLPSYESSFDVHTLKKALVNIENVHTKQYQGLHGFMDAYNSNYCQRSYLQAHGDIKSFLQAEKL